MPRLSRAQREAKEARKATVAAQLAADAQTSIGGSKSTSRPAPPPPLASALSNNQPIKITTSGTRGIAADEDELDGGGGTSIMEPQPSPSLSTIERTAFAGGGASSSLRGRKEASSSAVPGSPPPGVASDVSTSENSDDELNGSEVARGSASVPVDENMVDGEEDELDGDGALSDSSPEVKCMWEDCGQVFTSLIPFINHLHDEHVGIHKARYSCEWSGCPRKGKFQTSRFALLSHLRSHTGEKPFTCPRPECDKSFTRSDALAKHMRVQHNINPVSTRGKSANHLGMASGRASRMRGLGADEDDEFGLGGGGDGGEDGMGRGSADVLADELLELAEGESNGSLADVETSLLLHGAKSPFFTYDNLFGAGSRALAQLSSKGSGSGNATAAAAIAAANNALNIPDAELGIVRDTQSCTALLLNDEIHDNEAVLREEHDMARVLEAGRREWVRHEREQAELRPDPEPVSSKREVIDYLSDEDNGAGGVGDASSRSSLPKRSRRSSTRNAQRQAQSISDVASLKRLFIVEKAKLRYIRQENERMRGYLAELRTLERNEMLEKRVLLEKTLEAELGKDVGAIFSPPGSPGRS